MLKQGRLHPNNLVNRHVKFRDGSSIELMTVQGPPQDAMAQDYAGLIAAGEGGVYAALAVADLAGARTAAASLGLATRESRSGPWRFLGFPATSPAAAVFYSTGSVAVRDRDSLLNHSPMVDGLAEAWLEGGPELIAQLEALGASRCGEVIDGDGQTGQRLGLRRGQLVIVPLPPTGRPRVLGVVLTLPRGGAPPISPHPRFWVRYRSRP